MSTNIWLLTLDEGNESGLSFKCREIMSLHWHTIKSDVCALLMQLRKVPKGGVNEDNLRLKMSKLGVLGRKCKLVGWESGC